MWNSVSGGNIELSLELCITKGQLAVKVCSARGLTPADNPPGKYCIYFNLSFEIKMAENSKQNSYNTRSRYYRHIRKNVPPRQRSITAKT